MNSFRMYAGSDGETHFADTEIHYEDVSAFIARAAEIGASGIIFNHVKPGMFMDWHPAPRRQYVIGLGGEYEVETSDGEVRTVGPGTVMLAEDVAGKGHIMRVPPDQEIFIAFVPLADQTPKS